MPDVIKVGRKFLYDAQLTSGHGDTACATCHVFSNFDNVAWDLVNPQGSFVNYNQAPWVAFGPGPFGSSTNGFDPMKGPMTTQTLRGLKDLEPFHLRGDRQHLRDWQRSLGQSIGQSCAVHQLENQRGCTARTLEAVDRTDMRMIE